MCSQAGGRRFDPGHGEQRRERQNPPEALRRHGLTDWPWLVVMAAACRRQCLEMRQCNILRLVTPCGPRPKRHGRTHGYACHDNPARDATVSAPDLCQHAGWPGSRRDDRRCGGPRGLRARCTVLPGGARGRWRAPESGSPRPRTVRTSRIERGAVSGLAGTVVSPAGAL